MRVLPSRISSTHNLTTSAKNCNTTQINFFKYFTLNFNALGLKKLIATYYVTSYRNRTQLSIFGEDSTHQNCIDDVSRAVEINEVPFQALDGVSDIGDVEYLLTHNTNTSWKLRGDDTYEAGDFRSAECVELLRQSDIVVTNPPFSLFREFIAQLVSHDKKFLVIGNVNAITYKDIFSLIKDDKMWIGPSIHSGDREFRVPGDYPLHAAGWRIDAQGYKYIRVKGVRWFTNMDTQQRHEEIPLDKTYTPAEYPHYDNYDAINVNKVSDIPVDYFGVMGVPITFLDKYNHNQFEILGITDRDNQSGLKTKKYTENHSPNYGDLNARGVIKNGKEYKAIYARILIKRKKEH
jgi:hypothetical protein